MDMDFTTIFCISSNGRLSLSSGCILFGAYNKNVGRRGIEHMNPIQICYPLAIIWFTIILLIKGIPRSLVVNPNE